MNDLPDDIDLALRSVHDRAQHLRAALAFQLPLLAGRAALVWWAHGAYETRWGLDASRLRDAEETWSAALLCGFVATALTGLAFVRWTASLYEAAPSLRPGALRHTARSAWAFFAPIAQLWKPYAMISELHRTLSPHTLAAADGRDTSKEGTFPDAPVGAWWALWVGAGFVSLAGALLTDRSYRTTLPTNAYSELAATAMLLVAALLARRVVRLVTERAVERAVRIAAAPPPMSFA
ncbi:MAG: DUF4328 domain-containing protein [Polyangiales bacterium]